MQRLHQPPLCKVQFQPSLTRLSKSVPFLLQVKPESDFVSLGADSLDVVEIIMGLEEEFGIEIDQEVAATLKDVQAVANYIATN